MAIQNFISGGFYGKLGAMVGQRWKNKRTIRTYVKPHNPRTQDQQANRSRFSNCVKLAQIAMQMNFNAPCWNSEKLTEWNQRMSSATMLNKTELEPFNKIPLFPYAYVAKYNITNLKVKTKAEEGKITFIAEGTLPTEDRNISVLLGFINQETSAYDMELFQTVLTTDTDGKKVFTIEIEDKSKVNNQSIYLVCSNDDTNHENEAIYSPQIGATAKVEKEFDTTIRNYERIGKTHYFTFNEKYFDSVTTFEGITLNCIKLAEIEHINIDSLPLVKIGDYFGFTYTQEADNEFEIIAFGSDNNILINHISADSDTLLAKADYKDPLVNSTDNTRRMTATLKSQARMSSIYRIAFEKIINATYTIDEEFIIPCVSAGKIIEDDKPNTTAISWSSYYSIQLTDDHYSDSRAKIYTSISEIKQGSVKYEIDGITYILDFKGLKIEDTDKTAYWDNTLVSATRNKDTYIFKFKEENLDLTGINYNFYVYKTDYLNSAEVSVNEQFKRINGTLGIETRLNADEMGIYKYYLSDEAYVKMASGELINEVTYKPSIETNQNLGFTDNILYIILNKPPKCSSDLDEFINIAIDTISPQGGSDSQSAKFKFGNGISEIIANIGVVVDATRNSNTPSGAYSITELFGKVSSSISSEDTRLGAYNDESICTNGDYIWIGYDTEKVPSETLSVVNSQGKTINVQIALFENKEVNPNYYWYRSKNPITTEWEVLETIPIGFVEPE